LGFSSIIEAPDVTKPKVGYIKFLNKFSFCCFHAIKDGVNLHLMQ
jgi:hypothetical protein